MLRRTTAGTAELELTDLIYAALLGERSWQDFLDRLNAPIPGGISTLFFHDQSACEGGISLAAGLETRAAADYAAHYVGLNPWMLHVSATPLGTGIVGERIVPRDEFVRTEYYADFLRRQDIEAGIGVTLWREDGCSFLLSSLTSRIDPDENQRVADLLTGLAPHLVRAFRHYRTPRSGMSPAHFGASLLDSPHVGVIVVGQGLRVRAASPRGERFLEAGTVAGLTPVGRLALRDENTSAWLHQMLVRSYAGPRSRTSHPANHKLTLIRTEADGAAGYFAGPTVSVILEEAVAPSHPTDLEWLSERFGLTRAEARVASEIVAGLTPAEIAGKAGIARETVRTQLKSVYAKTGTNSQSGLVRLGLMHPART